ncbi:adenylate/guanylate cyclase domain-containing protein [Planctobacterium marinum]|uniref:Adenylate cyclase n=1 Tax=Planctobacterium marinum TaxID=1631968 RepID=A0AA48HNE3_9ALTE|nr:hypothetical protein MACH26_05600 [Planctobacterium marinum]
MKPTVGITTKIFAISVSVLLLLLIIAISTHLKIRTINTEVKYLAEHILPTVRLIDEATINMLEQEVHVERLLKLYHSPQTSNNSVDHEREQLELHFQRANRSLLAAEQLLAQALVAMPVWLSDTLTGNSIEGVIKVREENHQYHERAVFLIQHLDDETLTNVKEVELKLATAENELNRDAENVLSHLQNFAITTAQQAERHQEAILWQNLVLSVIAILVGLIYAGFLSRKLSQPVRELNEQVCRALEAKDYQDVTARSNDEVALLTSRFNLAMTTLRRSEQFKDMFGQYLDPRLISQLESNVVSVNLDGERQRVTVILSNLEGLTLRSGALNPEQLVMLINRYLEIQLSASSEYRGILNFTLTEILSFWTHPFSEQQQQSDHACHMLLAQIQGVGQFKDFLAQSEPHIFANDELEFRAGLASGDLVVANMGPSGARAFTVIGDEVNAASRLKGVARFFAINAVLSDEIVQSLSDKFVVRPLGWVKVPGKEDPIKTWHLMGYQKDLSQGQLNALAIFNEAFNKFEQRDFAAASQGFQQYLLETPEDSVTVKFIELCQQLSVQASHEDRLIQWEIGQK